VADQTGAGDAGQRTVRGLLEPMSEHRVNIIADSLPNMTTQRPPTIDPQAAARWQRLAQHESPWLHEEVGGRMEERLDLIRLQPQSWAHWHPVLGGLQSHQRIATRYQNSQSFVVEAPENKRQLAIDLIAKPWWHPNRWRGGAVQFEPPPEGTVQMVWANMALHMAADPQALIAAWHRALAVDGFLMFSCLGPDTLRELRSAYQHMGWPAPSHQFTDMHDWGDMLVQAGFAEPVMDMERITLSFATPERLLQELRSLGRNLHPARFAGLRGRGWLQGLHAVLVAELASQDKPSQANLTFEVIYGHAIKPAPRMKVQAETAFSLADMRSILRHGKSVQSGV
jgi:malonyl-CoA O-methyltransferase